MKIERNTTGFGITKPGIGYIIWNAPGVFDIEKGSTWLFTWSGASDRDEDTLQLLDVSEAQALGFPSDDDYDAFIRARSTWFSFDWSQTGATMPSSLFSRAQHMLTIAQEQMSEAMLRAPSVAGRPSGE